MYFALEEGHGGRRARPAAGQQRGQHAGDDRVLGVQQVVAALLHFVEVLQRGREDKQRRHRNGLQFGLERGEKQPGQKRETPAAGPRPGHGTCAGPAGPAEFWNGVGWSWCAPTCRGFADHTDQEHRRDVGQHHGKQRPSRRHAGVEVEQRLLEDQEGDVGARIARATGRGGVDLGKDAEQKMSSIITTTATERPRCGCTGSAAAAGSWRRPCGRLRAARGSCSAARS